MGLNLPAMDSGYVRRYHPTPEDRRNKAHHSTDSHQMPPEHSSLIVSRSAHTAESGHLQQRGNKRLRKEITMQKDKLLTEIVDLLFFCIK